MSKLSIAGGYDFPVFDFDAGYQDPVVVHVAKKKKKDPAKESEFWDGILKSADMTRGMPGWMGAGINLNPEHYVTHMPEPAKKTTKKTKKKPKTKLSGEAVNNNGARKKALEWASAGPSAPSVLAWSELPANDVKREPRWLVTFRGRDDGVKFERQFVVYADDVTEAVVQARDYMWDHVLGGEYTMTSEIELLGWWVSGMIVDVEVAA